MRSEKDIRKEIERATKDAQDWGDRDFCVYLGYKKPIKGELINKIMIRNLEWVLREEPMFTAKELEGWKKAVRRGWDKK